VRALRRVGACSCEKWQRVATAGALALLAAFVLVERAPLETWALTHPYFAVSEIIVSPTHRVREGALLQWMGLRPGVSIWTLDPRALEHRLEEHPWIRRARVRRELPRRLTIEVVEHEAAAVVLIDRLYYVDRTGIGLHRWRPRIARSAPRHRHRGGGRERRTAVSAPRRPPGREADRFDGPRRTSFRLSEVHIDRERGITVFPVEPQIELDVGWGRFPDKLARLHEVLAALRDARLSCARSISRSTRR